MNKQKEFFECKRHLFIKKPCYCSISSKEQNMYDKKKRKFNENSQRKAMLKNDF